MERDVLVTGAGVVCPIGVGKDQFAQALADGRSGVRRLDWYPCNDLMAPIGGEVGDFQAGQYVRPRKNLKVMSRDIQMAVVAAELAIRDAGIKQATVDPERFGVAFGADLMAADLSELVLAYQGCLATGKFEFSQWGPRAMSDLFPLWMLKYLPNMPACHMGISHDARGPNNTHTLGEVSSLTAIAEAADVIRRGQADVMIGGGGSSRLHPVVWLRFQCRQTSRREDDPAGACRPFDADRDGQVYGEGAAAFVLESRQHAEKRGAKPLARVAGYASAFAKPNGQSPSSPGIAASIRHALAAAGLAPGDVGHVNANGLGATLDDQAEARAIRETLGGVPVTAPKSYFGNLGAGGGAVEMLASLIALERSQIPPTLNYRRPDAACPVEVVHGAWAPAVHSTALLLNQSPSGQAAALVLAAP